ncbi:hypothetical protein AGMMS50230_12810 [Spirochaetia bacterium]|nr:hypothetical protein AGMMS50230_12810 [Spirochaetia bacterium]
MSSNCAANSKNSGGSVVTQTQCKYYEAGSAADKKAEKEKYKGKFGVGSGLGQMWNSLDSKGGSIDGGAMMTGAAKLGLGLLGGAVGIAVGAHAAKKRKAEKKAEKKAAEEAAEAEAAEAIAAIPQCDNPAALMAKNDGYTPITIAEFADRYSEDDEEDEDEDEDETSKKGMRFKSVAAVLYVSDSDDRTSINFRDVDSSDEEDEDDDDDYDEDETRYFDYPMPHFNLESGDEYLIYYNTGGYGFPQIEKIEKLTPRASKSWKSGGGIASVPAAFPAPAGPVCSCGTQLVPEAKFCPSCGKPAPVTAFCSNCGAQLVPDAKFCGGCGQPVA